MQVTSPLYTRSFSTSSKVTCAFQSPVQMLLKPCSQAHCPSSAEGLPAGNHGSGQPKLGAAPLSSPPRILRALLALQPQGLLHNCPTACTLPAARGQDPSTLRIGDGWRGAGGGGVGVQRMGVVQPLDCTLRLLMSANWARSPAAWFQSYPYPHQPVVDWTLWPHLR